MIGKDREVVKRSLTRYWTTTRKQLPLFVADVASAVALTGLLSFGNPFIMAQVIDRIAAGGVTPDQVIPVFGPYIIAFAIVNALGLAAGKLVDYTTWKLQIRANYDLATLAFDTLSNQSMTFHSDRFGGSLVNQTTRFLSAYSMLLENFIYAVIPISCAAVFTIVILAPVAPVFVAMLFVLLIAYIVLAYRMYESILPLNRNASMAYSKLFGELSDSVTNIMAVKTYGREDYERRLFSEANEQVLANDSHRMRASTARGVAVACIVWTMTLVLSFFVTGGNAWFGIAPGTLVMMFTYTYTLTTQFERIGMMLQQLNRALGDAHEMTAILDEPRLVADRSDAVPLVVEDGAIDFENVKFSYDAVGRPDAQAETQLFSDFNLHIPAGQRVGLVGKSGAGKTTLTALLLRLSDLQGGRILVDGQDITRCTQQSLRRQIAYVPQEALLFHRSIRENIAYGRPDASFDEIREAARLAYALEFIEALPDGFDTQVGERGTKLSGGQRQRIAIARAILADAPVLVLDEATSALDTESERLVQSALENLMSGRTSIVIAHRLSTVASLDRIVVLDSGTVVEDGTHASLIEEGGPYATLWSHQAGSFLQ